MQKAQLARSPAPSPALTADAASIPPASEAVAPEAGPRDVTTGPEEDRQRIELDPEKLRQAGRLPPREAVRVTEDEIRRIKWPILQAIAGTGGATATRNNAVLVTSALPGEGKTFTSLMLALSIVRDRDSQVILVDGDVARPGLTPAFGLQASRGLNDVLDDATTDVKDVIYDTSVEGLSFVPAGRWLDHSPEFFASQRMTQIVEELCRRARPGVVIIDSPPMLATNEAQAVTRIVGQILMVVHADQTEQRAVAEAISLIDKSTPVNAVLNRVEPSLMSRFYGHYYYGYGGDYYGSRRQEKSK
jgi:exopolysaccharide/PEP-CTERM locus tyrosine autokinase